MKLKIILTGSCFYIEKSSVITVICTIFPVNLGTFYQFKVNSTFGQKHESFKMALDTWKRSQQRTIFNFSHETEWLTQSTFPSVHFSITLKWGGGVRMLSDQLHALRSDYYEHQHYQAKKFLLYLRSWELF